VPEREPTDWKDFVALTLAVFELVLPVVAALFFAVLLVFLLLRFVLH